MTTKTVAAILTTVTLAGSAAAAVQVLDQGQCATADAATIRSTSSDGALFHLVLNAAPGAVHQRPSGVVYLTR